MKAILEFNSSEIMAPEFNIDQSYLHLITSGWKGYKHMTNDLIEKDH